LLERECRDKVLGCVDAKKNLKECWCKIGDSSLVFI